MDGKMASTPQEGQKAPDFALKDEKGKTHKLSDYKGKQVILYFYPKDDTPGCTTQACDFRDHMEEFKEKNAVILGVSPDDEASHRKFIAKHRIPYTLLCDADHKAADRYGVWGEKQFMGRRPWASSAPRSSLTKKASSPKPSTRSARTRTGRCFLSGCKGTIHALQRPYSS